MVNFLLALIELFLLSIMVPELWGEMCTGALFSRGRPLCTQILPGQGRLPATILVGIRKLKNTGLPDGEDHITLCSLVLT